MADTKGTAERVHDSIRKQYLAEQEAKNNRPITIELGELTGSEKQIAWAEDIRREIVQDTEEQLRGGEDGEMLELALQLLEQVVAKRTEARFWIDGRHLSARKTIEYDLQDAAQAHMG